MVHIDLLSRMDAVRFRGGPPCGRRPNAEAAGLLNRESGLDPRRPLQINAALAQGKERVGPNDGDAG